MKKIEINGVAKMDVYKSRSGDFATIAINGVRLEQLLAEQLLEKGASGEDESKTSLCKISISIEKHDEALTVNGVEMPLEL